MPAPAVYVLALVGTVGAVLAFKEFVYEPHIAPAIDRWKLEYRTARDARRRRLAMEVSQDGSDSDLLMSETRKRSKDKPSDKYSDDDDSDDEAHGKGATTGTSHSFMKGGLLIRRSTLVAKSQLDVELDDLVAHEVNQWRSEVPGQVLRQRKNVSEHAMDESIQPIPYKPMSPSRTSHVVFDAAAPSPSPPTSHMQLPSPPPPHIASAPPTGVTPAGLSFQSQSEMTSSPAANPTARDAELAPSLHPPVPSPEAPAMPSPPEVTPFQHMATQSTLLANTPQLPPTFNAPPTIPAPSLQQSYHQIIPSLSQSYPQDLDYEHDLELLSPPSSRADSPFSLAALSSDPEQRTSSRTLSAFSSAVSSPSPLRMDLGNQSYDAISPLPQVQRIAPSEGMSASAQSTAYLSFGEDDDSDEDGVGAPLRYHQPAALHPSLLHGPYHTSASPPQTARLRGLPAGSAAAAGQASAHALGRAGSDGTLHPEGAAGLGLFPVPARGLRTPAGEGAGAYTANAAVALGAGARDAAFFRASASASTSTSASVSVAGSAAGSPSATAASYLTAQQGSDSASELSDLDFLSDYPPSEASDLGGVSEAGSEASDLGAASDLGGASDGGWSVASAGGAPARGEADAGPGPGPRSGVGRPVWRA